MNNYYKYKTHYLNKIVNNFIVDDTKFELYIRNILNINKYYYKECTNISFNELLLHKNVNNIIKGTDYSSLGDDLS